MVKVCDFREPRKFKDNGILSLGYFEYLAPEFLENRNVKCNEKTDIWALGIILYKMMTKNMHPFLQRFEPNENNLFPSIKKILKEEKLKIGPSIEDLIVRKILKGCLMKFPKSRINMTQLLDFLKMGNSIGDNSLFLSSLSSEQLTKLWEGSSWKFWERLVAHNHKYMVNSVCFSPDGSKIISGSDDETVKFWDFSSGNLLNTFVDHSESVNSVAFSRDGLSIVSGSNDKTLKIWDVASLKLLKTLNGHLNYVASVDFSNDGSMIVSGSWDRSIILWHTLSGKILKEFKDHSDWVRSVCFSMTELRIVSGSTDKTIKLWDVSC